MHILLEEIEIIDHPRLLNINKIFIQFNIIYSIFYIVGNLQGKETFSNGFDNSSSQTANCGA